MLDVWKEIFLGVSQDPDLRVRFDLVKIFEYIAELGGAKNLENMKINVQAVPDDVAAQQAQAGNTVPIPGGSGTPGVIQSPGDRAGGRI